MRHLSTAIAVLLAVYAVTAAGRAANQSIVRSAELPAMEQLSAAG